MLNVSGGNLAIGISLLMRDGFSGPAATASASMANMTQQMSKAQMTMARNANLLGAAIGIGVISRMGKWVKEGAKFGYTMKYVHSLTAATNTEFKDLEVTALKLGQNTMRSSQEVASGMRYMAMAGMTAREIQQNIKGATELSVATLHQLGGKGGTADIMTNVMRGFQIPAEHAMRVADVLTMATTQANTNIFDLGDALKYSASTAMDLKIGLEEVSVMAMMAGNAGIQGSMAGTAIENMLRYITLATSGDRKKATKALGFIGLSPKDLVDAHGNLKSIGSIMHTIATQAEKAGKGTAEKQNIYMRLFGVRGKRQGSLMLRNMKEFDQMLKDINQNSAGVTAKVAAGQMNTVEGRMKQLSDTWANFKVYYTRALKPVVKPFLELLTITLKTLNSITQTKFGRFLLILASGWVIAKTATMAFRAALLTVRLLTGQFAITSTSATARTAAGWNSAAAAAARYGGVVGSISGMGRAGWGPGGVGAFRGIYKTKGGTPYKINPKTGMATFVTKGTARKGMLGKFGKGMGGAGFGIGMLGALGLGMASNAVGTETTGGKALSTLSDAANFGMIGATVGSFIPVIGTAVGGVVGAVGGALWNLYNQTKAIEDEVNDNAKTKDNIFNTEAWRRKAEIFTKLKEGDIYMQGRTVKQMDSDKMNVESDKYITNEVILNLDGVEIFRQEIQSQGSKAEFNIGLD